MKSAVTLIKSKLNHITAAVCENCWLLHPPNSALLHLFLQPGFKCTPVARILYNDSNYIAVALGKRCTAHM